MKIIFRLTEPTEYTRHYETAAWWTKITVQPGDYEARPIDQFNRDTTLEHAKWVVVTMPGVVLDEYMPSLYGGVPIAGSDRGKERVGQETTHSLSPYAYAVRGYVKGDKWGLPGEWIAVDETC